MEHESFEYVQWHQPDKTKFRTQSWEYWNIESVEFNPERAITEDSPISHRCQSQFFNPAKVSGPILGNPVVNWDLPMVPDPSSLDYTDEVPWLFRECLQVVRDAVRPRSKEFKEELEGQEGELQERISGRGDSSEEILDVQGGFSDDNSRCTRCGSWNCNLSPAICSRQNRYELFKVFYRHFLDGQ